MIKGLSATIEPGHRIAIVGPTGAGKTTLVNLLMRFYEVGSGDITIDGVSIKNMKREDVRQLFGMVLQDTWLFSGTIRDNITYGAPEATEVLIQKAMDNLMKNKTSFVIAHRLSTIRDADLILVMKDGNVIEQGDHHSLMQQNGFYAGLYNSQFAGATE